MLKTNNLIKVLIVDDSSFIRTALRKILATEANIEVVGEAENGQIAVQLTEELEPDLITMDLEMPIMNGFEAIEQILAKRPLPIIVVSSLTQAGTEATYRALKLGAIDYISKSSNTAQIDTHQIEIQLKEKIKFWQNKKISEINYIKNDDVSFRSGIQYNPNVLRPANNNNQFDIAIIGVSTGGPAQLAEILAPIDFNKIKCPIVIGLHIEAEFTDVLVEHLKFTLKTNNIIQGENNLILKSGMVVVAPGGLSSEIQRNSKQELILKTEYRSDAPMQPWIDLLFKSTTTIAKAPLGVILTGVDQDGLMGAKILAKQHAPILVQTPDSCIADGLPNIIISSGLASEILNPRQLGERLNQLLQYQV